MAVRLAMGNPAPREWVLDDPATGTGHYDPIALADGQAETITRTNVPDGFAHSEVAQAVALPGGIWDRNSGAAAPTWVADDGDGTLATIVAAFCGGVQVKPWADVQTLADAIGYEL